MIGVKGREYFVYRVLRPQSMQWGSAQHQSLLPNCLLLETHPHQSLLHKRSKSIT